jgi:hypothetical protein
MGPFLTMRLPIWFASVGIVVNAAYSGDIVQYWYFYFTYSISFLINSIPGLTKLRSSSMEPSSAVFNHLLQHGFLQSFKELSISPRQTLRSKVLRLNSLPYPSLHTRHCNGLSMVLEITQQLMLPLKPF